ncbi:hypothetical protein BST28_17455 [Mycolicibacter kumamotonensis]|uniref:Uncharacterized protein n=1 Tax=Mycolicibacter kumamotonensis TaxID=354243 RepID=A0A1X0DZ97_9MYCO|nr:hypothetical protein [Mycolicibacter kumamotonensis]ORA77589.1 hypothetical protein BST28_17455 [Mycolicibacter kumamotonensis]
MTTPIVSVNDDNYNVDFNTNPRDLFDAEEVELETQRQKEADRAALRAKVNSSAQRISNDLDELEKQYLNALVKQQLSRGVKAKPRPNPFGVPLSAKMLDDIERASHIFTASPKLQEIAYTAALERVSAWGMLAVCQMNMATWVDATHVLVKSDGSEGKSLESGTSLSTYVALTSLSGGGKSKTFKAAREVVKPFMRPITDGTGQGLIKQFAEVVKITRDEDGKPLKEPYYVTQYRRHMLLVNSPEVKKLNAEFLREGSQTDAMMRSMWSGETTGNMTSDVNRQTLLIDNTYRIHAAWGVQPENSKGIMDGVADGTPQRFVWAPSLEQRTKARAPKRVIPPPGVTFPKPTWNIGGNVFGGGSEETALPSEVKDDTVLPDPVWIGYGRAPLMQLELAELQERQDAALATKSNRDEWLALTDEEREELERVITNSHGTLTRIKQAVLFAWLDGRPEPTDMDWVLAKAQMMVSRATAAFAYDEMMDAMERDARKVGEQRGAEMFAANNAKDALEQAHAIVAADTFWNKLSEHGPFPKDKYLRDRWSKRAYYAAGMEYLEKSEQIAVRPDAHGDPMLWALKDGNFLPADKFARVQAAAAAMK